MPSTQKQAGSDNITDKQYGIYRDLGDGRTSIAITNPDGSVISSAGGNNTSVSATGAVPPANATYVAFKDNAGNLAGASLDVSGNLKVAGSFTPANPADGTASGSLGALNASVVLALTGYYGVGVNLSSGLVGSVQAFLSYDGGVTYPRQTEFYAPDTGSFGLTISNPNGAYGISLTGGASHVKILVSAYSSGSTTATLRSTYASTPDLQSVAVSNFPTTQAVSGTVTTVVGSANNNWAQALATTSAATATIISIASSVAGYQLKGFIAHGTGDGYFFVQIGAVTVLSGRTRATLPTVIITLPNGLPISTGSAVTLKVTNESGSTADYEATLLGA